MAFNPVEVGYLKLKSILGTSLISDIDEWAKNLIEELSAKLVSYSEDTLVKRPSAGHANRLFLATDNSGIYKDTGAEWKVLPSPTGGSISGTAAESASIGASLNAAYALWYLTLTVTGGTFTGQIKRQGGGETVIAALELPPGKYPLSFMLRPGEQWAWIKTVGGAGLLSVAYIGNGL